MCRLEKKAGCKTVLINNGGETEWVLTVERTPDITSRTIDEAAKKILQTDKALVDANS